jgi:hypothetical protein
VNVLGIEGIDSAGVAFAAHPEDLPHDAQRVVGMPTMGFSPPAAIGAKLGAPDRKVICLAGDGGFLSVLGALTTAVEAACPCSGFCLITIASRPPELWACAQHRLLLASCELSRLSLARAAMRLRTGAIC